MNLNELLKKNKISAYKLAKKLGLSPQTIYHYIWGDREPSAKTMLKLAEILNVSAEKILKIFAEKEEK